MNSRTKESLTSKVSFGSLAASFSLILTMNIVLLAGIHKPEDKVKMLVSSKDNKRTKNINMCEAMKNI